MFKPTFHNLTCVCLLLLVGCERPAKKTTTKDITTPAPKVEHAAPSKKADDQATVVFKGTPQISAELKKSFGKYLDMRSASLADLSDDGSEMLIRTRFGETSQAHIVTQPGGARTQLTFLSEPVSAPRFVPGTTRELTYLVDQGGNEDYQLFYFDLQSREEKALTQENARVRVYVWSDDGTALAYSSNKRNGKDMDIYVFDGKKKGELTWEKGASRQLLQVSGFWYPIEWSKDKTTLLVGEHISIAKMNIYLVDVKTGQKTLVTTKEAAYRDAAFAGANNRLFVTSDRDGEFVQLYEVDVATQTWTPLTNQIPWNIESIALSKDAKTIALTANEDGLSKLYLLDVETRKLKRVKLKAAGIIHGLTFARSQDILGYGMYGPTMSGDVYSYDLERAEETRWTHSEMGAMVPEKLVEPELIRYQSFDGQSIPAFYFKPKTPGPHPVVIRIHGGPEAQARPYFSATVQYFVSELNIAVLVPNVRGSDGYGKTYFSLDNGFKREDSVKDIGSLLDWIANNKDLDENRVGVVGGSYGGYMVLASLVHFGNRIAAGCEIVGISNFVTFLENTKAYRRQLRRVEYGDERSEKMRSFLQSISPLNNADKIKSALFVAHGANDPRVPVGEAEQIVEAVEKQGQDVWYMLARNEGHGFTKKENRDAYHSLMFMFFKKHLTEPKQ